MSCSLTHLTRASDWLQVRNFLFPDQLLDKELVRDDDLDNRWNWDSGNDDRKSDVPTTDHQWLAQCHVCISPDGKLLVIGRDNRLAALYDRHGLLEILATKTLDVRASDESISSLNCIPLASQQKSNEGGIDWTAILVGFTSGKLRVYTDSGCLLLQQKIHDEPITGISCSSFYSPALTGRRYHPEQPDHTDQIILSFCTVAAFVEGFVFYQTVRSARSHLAKLAINQNISQYVADIGVQLPVTKWSFKSDHNNQIQVMASAGLNATSMYDHLVNMSLAGASQRSTIKQSVATTLVTAGESPFVGFYETFATDSPSLLNNVAQAVVNKARNLMPLFGSRKDEAVESPVIPLAERVGLYDQHRRAFSIVFSPNKRHMAVTDDFGRVILCDVQNWIAVRMWKGYRDAQCAFVEVNENSPADRKSLCLVIYARRRGVIEVWKCERGPRISCMNVGKNCTLFNATHHIFGLNQAQWQKHIPAFDKCFILNHEDGCLSFIDLPFACTLTDANSAAARDKHLLKELAAKSDPDSVSTILKQLQSTDARKEALKSSFESTERARMIASILGQQMKEVVSSTDPDLNGVFDDKMILQSCCRVLQLCELYTDLSSQGQLTCPASDFGQSLPEDIDSLSETMGWQAVDVAKCLSLLSLHYSVIPVETCPIPRIQLSFTNFMKGFQTESTRLYKTSEGSVMTENIPVQVNWKQPKSESDLLVTIAQLMFQSIVDKDVDPKTLLGVYDKSCIVPKHLMKLLCVSWLSSNYSCSHWRNWVTFSLLMRTMSSQISEDWSEGSLSITWKSICGLIVSSPNLSSALVAMFVAKSVSDSHLTCKKDQEVENEAMSEMEEDWETLHVDIEKLNIAVKQLEDAFLLDLLLRTDTKAPHQSLSLEALIKSSPGIVSELVARWFVNGGFDVVDVFDAGDRTCDDTGISVDGRQVENATEASALCSHESLGTHAEILQHVLRCFPHSLNSEVILANCCWESALRWHKNPSVESSCLKACIRYLHQLSSLVLRHNIACLIWKTFVVKNMESLAELTEKMAKIPKDRICRRDVGMGDDCLDVFISFAAEILEVIMDNVKVAESESPPMYGVDEWWRDASRSRDLSLIQTACLVKTSNSSLVLAHLHLVQVLQFMTTFQLKNVKPLSLFMDSVRQSLFQDLHIHAHGFEVPLSDFNMNEKRRQFLSKVIVCIAHSTPAPDETTDGLMVTPSRAFGDSNKLFGKVLTLSREWELSTDVFRRRFVCELYASACDHLAREVQNSCRDKNLLSIELLPIACRRIDLMFNLEKSSVDPHALQWMHATECEQTVTSAPKEWTELLLEFLIANLPEGSQAVKVAGSLLETIRMNCSAP